MGRSPSLYSLAKDRSSNDQQELFWAGFFSWQRGSVACTRFAAARAACTPSTQANEGDVLRPVRSDAAVLAALTPDTLTARVSRTRRRLRRSPS